MQKFEDGEGEDDGDYVLVDASPSPLGGALAHWGVPSPALRSIPVNADPAMQPEQAQIWAPSCRRCGKEQGQFDRAEDGRVDE